MAFLCACGSLGWLDGCLATGWLAIAGKEKGYDGQEQQAQNAFAVNNAGQIMCQGRSPIYALPPNNLHTPTPLCSG